MINPYPPHFSKPFTRSMTDILKRLIPPPPPSLSMFLLNKDDDWNPGYPEVCPSDWEEWTNCTTPCNEKSVKLRFRGIEVVPVGNFLSATSELGTRNYEDAFNIPDLDKYLSAHCSIQHEVNHCFPDCCKFLVNDRGRLLCFEDEMFPGFHEGLTAFIFLLHKASKRLIYCA